VFSVGFSPDGRRLVSAGDQTVRVWNPQTAKQLNVFSFGGRIVTAQGSVAENLSAVAFSPDGVTLAVVSTTGSGFVVAPDTGRVLHELKTP
jgi:WD40 repeat protein